MKRFSGRKTVWSAFLLIALAMSMSLFSCGGGGDKEETAPSTETKAEETTQTFTTTDGTYQITAGSDWTENSPYDNSDSSLEIEIGGGITTLQIIKQPKSDLPGMSLSDLSDQVVDAFVNNTELGSSSVESTENVKCGEYDAIRKVIVTDESSTGIDMLTCHLTIDTGTDYMQLIVISTESNRDNVMEYAETIAATVTPLD